MIIRWSSLLLIATAAALALAGCDKKDATAADRPSVTVNSEEIASVRDNLTRNMRRVALDKLKASYRGTQCVVTATIPDSGLPLQPPPPPPGMVQRMGQAVFYTGQFRQVSDESLTIGAAYPTSGNYKEIEIATDDIDSVHLAQ